MVFCGNQKPSNVTSPANELWIRFKSKSGGRRGFRAWFGAEGTRLWGEGIQISSFLSFFFFIQQCILILISKFQVSFWISENFINTALYPNLRFQGSLLHVPAERETGTGRRGPWERVCLKSCTFEIICRICLNVLFKGSKYLGGGGGGGYFGLILAGYVRLAYQNPYLITSLFCGHVIDPILVIFGTK